MKLFFYFYVLFMWKIRTNRDEKYMLTYIGNILSNIFDIFVFFQKLISSQYYSHKY
jgi:hypothetical protein